ncbi:ShlB/FhaC/HecB family hemolysin secretion/activation protein [Neisseria sp. Ec49-e6-T10]|uniref:ShlB/FhaC/HecB family hemolysin secretion/activation protein n=1 Tax=Neisseria sp. Ec49-e6-T10 TaxID=3140744 RepID=UPI003EBC238E
MKNKIKPLLIFVTLCCSFQATAQVNLNRLIKAQEDLDKNTRQENKIEKRDVYSSVEDSAITDIELPIEENCVQIEEVVIENDFLNDASIKKIKENVVGRCLGALGVEKLASDLQDHVIKSGFVTTRVAIPNQDLSSHKLLLSIEPGKIERVIIKDNEVRDWILPFKSEEILNLRNIEQGLEVLQKTPEMEVKINIEPGSKDGYSNVVVDTKRISNWNARAWVNNWGDKGTGKTLASGAGYLYNLAKMNDVFYLSGTTNIDHVKGGYNSVSAYYSVPFGYWDYELFYSNSKSKQTLNIATFDFNYIGKSEYLSLKGSRTVYRDQDKKVALSAELLRRKANYQLDDIELVLQKRDMTNIRLALNYKQNFSGAALNTTLSYQRFLPWFGAEKTPDMKTGDVDSKSHITNLDLNYMKLLKFKPFDAYYDLRVGAQYSPKGLTLQDQFSIGNRWSVRGFENGAELYGNKGFYVQNTFNVMTGIKNIEWYLGADYGQVWGETSTHKQRLLGATTGFKGNINSLSYDVSVSKPLISPKALETDKLNINFNISYQL